MAFTKTPMASTEETKPISLLYQWDCRDNAAGGKDTLLKNALFEPVGQEYFHMMKRNGTETITLTPTPDGPIVGIYHWVKTTGVQRLVVVHMNAVGVGVVSLYTADTFTLTSGPTPIAGLNKGDIEVSFQEFLYQDGTADLMFTTSGGLFRITPAEVVSGPIAGAAPSNPVYLDGYLFGLTGATIANSNLNDPTTWSASNFLAVDSYADTVLRLARVGPYIVAFGGESIQYFYDAANPTGTPLGVNTGATKRIGYLGGLASIGDDILFIGSANQSNPTLYRMSGLKVEALASFPFSRFWVTQGTKYDISVAPSGSILDLNGHNVYYVRTPSTPFPVGSSVPNPLIGDSYIYDLDSSIWSKLGYKALDYYLIMSTTTYASAIGVAKMTYVNILGDSTIHRFNPAIYQDDGVNFEVKFRTRMLDFGTRRKKFGSRFLVAGDQTSSSSLAQFSWSDDDYKTTSTPRSVDMQYSYQQLYALGSFYARSFTMTYSDNFPMRWQTLELDYDQGDA
jgi:hypothetical protein